MSLAPDPYAMHALLLVYGADRAELAQNIRDEANAVEHARDDDGAAPSPIAGAEGACIVRPSFLKGAEEANACRMFGVFRAESDNPNPIALFSERDAAHRFADCGADLCVMRTDVIMSSFNHIDQAEDPYPAELERREERGAA